MYGLNLPRIKAARMRLMRKVKSEIEMALLTLEAAQKPDVSDAIAESIQLSDIGAPGRIQTTNASLLNDRSANWKTCPTSWAKSGRHSRSRWGTTKEMTEHHRSRFDRMQNTHKDTAFVRMLTISSTMSFTVNADTSPLGLHTLS